MDDENRKIRFATIEGIDREDLPIAYEVWCDDLCMAPWATREMMKLAVHMCRYMQNPAGTTLRVREMESFLQVTAEEIRKTLAAMKGFGAVDDFTADRIEIRVSLVLSVRQRLRVLETKMRFASVLPANAPCPWLAEPARWLNLPAAKTAVAA